MSTTNQDKARVGTILHLNGQNVKTEDGRNIYVGDTVSDENKKLAALIVKAVNEHAALTAVADKAKCLEKAHDESTGSNADIRHVRSIKAELFQAIENLEAVRKESTK